MDNALRKEFRDYRTEMEDRVKALEVKIASILSEKSVDAQNTVTAGNASSSRKSSASSSTVESE